MPQYNITSPDGRKLRITAPEGATQEQVLAYAQSNMAQPAQPTDNPEVSTGARFIQGMKDPVNGIGQMMLHGAAALTGNETLKSSAQGLDERLSDEEKRYQSMRQAAGQDGIDWARLGGGFTTTLPAAAALPAAGATLKARMALGALGGAAISSTSPVTDPEANYAQEKASQLGIGAATGALAAPVMSGISRVISPKSSPDVQSLLSNGVRLTPGQVMGGTAKSIEDRLTSVPLLGDMINNARRTAVNDLNSVVLNRALQPIGRSTKEVGNEGVAAVKDALGDAYTAVLPNLNLSPSPQLAGEIGALRNGMRPDIRQTFDDIFKTSVLNRMQSGQLTGNMLKDAESELSTQARNFARSSIAAEREIGNHLKDALGIFRTNLEVQNPEFAPILQRINQGYGTFKVASRASSNDISGGVFTPAQLQRAVRQADGVDRFAAGRARLQDISQPAQNVMGNSYPDSGTAGRNLLAMILAGGTAFNPALAATGALAMAPYTGAGSKIASALLARRPGIAEPIAQGARELTPYARSAMALMLSGNSTGGN